MPSRTLENHTHVSPWHVRPDPHILPVQQGWPAAPQVRQTSPAPHTSDAVPHIIPAQHGWPASPHVAQVPLAHPSPAEHMSFAQHA